MHTIIFLKATRNVKADTRKTMCALIRAQLCGPTDSCQAPAMDPLDSCQAPAMDLLDSCQAPAMDPLDSCQAPLSVEFSRHEFWAGLTFSPPGVLPDPGIESASFASPALAGRFFTTTPPGKPKKSIEVFKLHIEKYLTNYTNCWQECGISVQHFATPSPLLMGFSRQEFRSGLLCPPPGGLPNPGADCRAA